MSRDVIEHNGCDVFAHDNVLAVAGRRGGGGGMREGRGCVMGMKVAMTGKGSTAFLAQRF